MLLDTPRSRALSYGFDGNALETAPTEELPPCLSVQAPNYKPAEKPAGTPLERLEILASFGLTDRDLEFMGPQQRAMVEDVVEHVRCVHNVS